MPLDDTPGGEDSNSYVSVSDATALLSERLGMGWWLDEAQLDQEAALIWATRLLDEQVIWVGTPASATQALEWPRLDVVDSRGRPVDSATIPEDIERATAEYAAALLQESKAMTGATVIEAGTVKSRKI